MYMHGKCAVMKIKEMLRSPGLHTWGPGSFEFTLNKYKNINLNKINEINYCYKDWVSGWYLLYIMTVILRTKHDYNLMWWCPVTDTALLLSNTTAMMPALHAVADNPLMQHHSWCPPCILLLTTHLCNTTTNARSACCCRQPTYATPQLMPAQHAVADNPLMQHHN